MAKKLFEKISIGKMELRNRIVLPPMVRNWGTEEGLVTDRLVNHYRELARGGTAMLITEASFVSPEGKGFGREMGIDRDECLPGLKKLAGAAHEHGAKIGPQLYHAGRQTNSKVTGVQPVAPSPIACPVMQEEPHELTIEEITAIEDKFADSARRAKEAGFDFVEVHGAHGYLIMQFLSPYSNKREDEYGGSLENRFRFVKNIIAKIRQQVGEDFPIIVRISGEEGVPNGLELKDTQEIAKMLEGLGIDALHVSIGNYATYQEGLMIPPMAIEAGPLVYLAAGIKEAVNIPVITVGKINTPELAEAIITSGQADLVALGRELIADPKWPDKVENNSIPDINRCIACNQGCIDRLFQQEDTQCLVNPCFGREEEFKIEPAKEVKNVMVIGGGPAGMQAAIVAKARGHNVSIYEKSGELGGELKLAEIPPHRQGMTWFKEYLIGRVHKMEIEEHLNTEVTRDIVAKNDIDHVIIATGSECAMPNIPGVDSPIAVMPPQALTGEAKLGKKVIIAGGGSVGSETAEYLAEKGHRVIITEMGDGIASDMGISDRHLLLERFKKMGVEIMTNAKIIKISGQGLSINRQGKEEFIEADNIVLCLGAKPINYLAKEISDLTAVVDIVGDAKQPRTVLEAVYEGYLAALNI